MTSSTMLCPFIYHFCMLRWCSWWGIFDCLTMSLASYWNPVFHFTQTYIHLIRHHCISFVLHGGHSKTPGSTNISRLPWLFHIGPSFCLPLILVLIGYCTWCFCDRTLWVADWQKNWKKEITGLWFSKIAIIKVNNNYLYSFGPVRKICIYPNRNQWNIQHTVKWNSH